MEFKKQFPDYLNYKNEESLINVVTEELVREIAQRLPRVYIQQKQQNRYLNLDGTFKNACDIVSVYTNNEKTKNWGYDFIIRDFEEQVVDFKLGKFHKFMDDMSELAKNDNVFEDNNFGYKLTNESKYNWLYINPNVGEVVNFEELIITTSELCK